MARPTEHLEDTLQPPLFQMLSSGNILSHPCALLKWTESPLSCGRNLSRGVDQGGSLSPSDWDSPRKEVCWTQPCIQLGSGMQTAGAQ